MCIYIYVSTHRWSDTEEMWFQFHWPVLLDGHPSIAPCACRFAWLAMLGAHCLGIVSLLFRHKPRWCIICILQGGTQGARCFCGLTLTLSGPILHTLLRDYLSNNSLFLRIENGAGKQGYGTRPSIDNRNPTRKFSIDPHASKTNGTTRPQLIHHGRESKRKADKEIQYRPRIVDTHIDCGPRFCGPRSCGPCSETPIIARYAFWVSQHGQIGYDTPGPSASMRTWGAIPPRTRGVSQRYLRETLWNEAKRLRYPSAILSREGLVRYGGHLSLGL